MNGNRPFGDFAYGQTVLKDNTGSMFSTGSNLGKPVNERYVVPSVTLPKKKKKRQTTLSTSTIFGKRPMERTKAVGGGTLFSLGGGL